MEMLTTEMLDDIERIAAAAYTPKQTAFILGFKPSEFLKMLSDENNDACIAYYKGFYSSEIKIREGVFQLARSGSSPAQTLAVKMFDDTRKTILKDGITEAEI